jgi:glycosyltransferase involved in cell wall biosynthesis
MKNKYLFNFSSSYVGGGLRRLIEYSKWFDTNAGANFIIHPRACILCEEYSNNTYHVIQQHSVSRLFSDCSYLKEIIKKIGIPELYFSYGIPIYSKIGIVNWFHLSNLLSIQRRGIPMSLILRIKMIILGYRIINYISNCDIVSAESLNSLKVLSKRISQVEYDQVVLENGCDPKLLQSVYSPEVYKSENYSVVIGTFKYKCLERSYSIFKILRQRSDDLKLYIIGEKENIPHSIRKDNSVVALGVMYSNQQKVYDYLKKAKYFITTSLIENSSVASLEGLLLSEESYVSDIPPHRELLDGCNYERFKNTDGNMDILHINRKDALLNVKTQSWDQVITKMLNKSTEFSLIKSE